MKKLRLSLLIAVTFLSCVVAGNAKAQTNPCTYVAPSTTQQITGPDSVCKQVTNNSATNNLCVMTATTAQWQSFYNNPNGATLAACSSPIYVANINSNTVSVINGATNAVTATIAVVAKPQGVAVNASTNTVYVANFLGNTV